MAPVVVAHNAKLADLAWTLCICSFCQRSQRLLMVSFHPVLTLLSFTIWVLLSSAKMRSSTSLSSKRSCHTLASLSALEFAETVIPATLNEHFKTVRSLVKSSSYTPDARCPTGAFCETGHAAGELLDSYCVQPARSRIASQILSCPPCIIMPPF